MKYGIAVFKRIWFGGIFVTFGASISSFFVGILKVRFINVLTGTSITDYYYMKGENQTHLGQNWFYSSYTLINDITMKRKRG